MSNSVPKIDYEIRCTNFIGEHTNTYDAYRDKKLRMEIRMNKVYISVYVVAVLALTAFFSFYPLILLDQNQIMYLYSATAQVVGGLFGLTIAGYVYHKNQNDQDKKSEPELELIVIEMNYISHRQIISIAILGFCSIFSSLISISVASSNGFWSNALFNFSMLCIISELIMLFSFAISITSPESRKNFCHKRVFKLGKNEKASRDIYVKILELKISILHYCNNLEKQLINEKPGIAKPTKSIKSMYKQLELYEKIDENSRNTLVETNDYLNYVQYAELRIGHQNILEDMEKLVKKLNIPVRNLVRQYEEETGKSARTMVSVAKLHETGIKKKRRK